MNSLARVQGALSTRAHPTGIRDHATRRFTLLQGPRSDHAVPLVHLPPPGHAAHLKRSHHSPLGAELAEPEHGDKSLSAGFSAHRGQRLPEINSHAAYATTQNGPEPENEQQMSTTSEGTFAARGIEQGHGVL
ncbi:hypothetical protein [Streptomyces sp. NPDC002853]